MAHGVPVGDHTNMNKWMNERIPLPIFSHTCVIIQATSVHMQHLVATFILYHIESGSAVLSQFLELIIALMV